ncbi:class I SAM-dependent methyltransferase [Nitrosopumilus sp. K4]|uniref:class I SAM-dependent methyltransferase n=1 Tax=Nitrosopumilus sp. K4 TaxID=2795383 RepID=UPI001BA64DEE|nr:class I SAM-dependent methyltransferase [Nitrosopumilus sp. K4]QUC63870.1 class I SAM-dependent methyltransferase [Nitrosopumilus sp. K4]
MDPVKKTFDEWAENGRAELMEREHGKNVQRFLKTIRFEKPFTFLDVGCGNGWVVRKIAQEKNCKKAIGIDKSKKMINQANKKKISKKESFIHTDIQSWRYRGKFDYVFSMESLYYVDSIEESLSKIFKMLRSEGEFFCGTDFYKDNKATARWAKMMNLKMHLHSKQEWRRLFNDAGFETKTKQIKNPRGNQKWKRDLGTLFIIGKKPKKQYSN